MDGLYKPEGIYMDLNHKEMLVLIERKELRQIQITL